MDALPAGRSWRLEQLTPDLFVAEAVERIVHSGRTAYQHVQIVDTVSFGRMLVLDGLTQSSEADEWVYHEALVQPVMLAHRNPERVFIAGGGEGATAREVLRHRTVREVVMADLDPEVVALCREHMPRLSGGAFDDPRLTLLFEDARVYLEEHEQPFDVIIIDVPDPLEAGPAYPLFTREFYRLLRSRLRPGGLMAAQSGPAGPTTIHETFTAVHRTIASELANASPYCVGMPSFGLTWGFVAAGLPDAPNVAASAAEAVDAAAASRLDGESRYYDGAAHAGMFGLPRFARQALAEETRLITMDAPLFAYQPPLPG